MSASAGMERRVVRSDDPSLSPHANELLTEELRKVVGADVVEVPVGRPHEESARHGGHGGTAVALVDNRVTFAMVLLGAIVVGAVITLMTGSWWFLGVAVVLDVVGVLLMTTLIIRMTGEVEHLPPETSALLEAEGVEDPDGVFSRLVAEFSPS